MTIGQVPTLFYSPVSGDYRIFKHQCDVFILIHHTEKLQAMDKVEFLFAYFQILGPLGCQGWVVMPKNVK